VVEPINQEEFDTVGARRRHTLESEATRRLLPGTGIKMPCRWKHNDKNDACGGGASLRVVAIKSGFQVKASCREGTLYLFRYE